MNLLVIDIGSTSTKGSVYNENFTLLASHRVHTPPHYINETYVEQNPLAWKNAVLEIMRTVREKQIIFGAVTVTSQRSSVFLVDVQGAPLCNAIMWQDCRTQPICCDFSPDTPFIYKKTGLPLKPIFGAPKMVWLRNNKPELYAAAHKIVTVADYVLHLLTGQFVTDYTYGNRSLLMNLHELCWDEELLALFSVKEQQLCRLVAPGSACGMLLPEIAQPLGLGREVQVFTAGGDQQVASLGLGVLQAGRAEVTHGTGSFCIFHSDKVVQDEKTQLICNVAAVPGAYIIESSCLTTGAAYDWLLKEFYACTGYAQINEEIATTPPLSNGVVVLPHFQGVGAPDWNPQAKGMICNLSLCSKRGDIARALLEGIAVDVARNLEMIEKAVGQAQVLCLSGGLTNLPAFNQLQADIYNRCTVICSNNEATSAGAWISWMKQTGRCESYEQAFVLAQKTSSETTYWPCEKTATAYQALKLQSRVLYERLWQ